MKLISTLLVTFFLSFSAAAAEFPRLESFTVGMDVGGKRFLVPATINGKPANLAFDTGAQELFLFKPAAERLGLKLPQVPSDTLRKNGKFPVVETKPYQVTLFDTNGKIPIPVANFSVGMDVDGCAGWSLFKKSIFQIDVANRVIRSLPKVPPEARQWMTLRMQRSSDVFCVELPGANKAGVILIDTGSYDGISLNLKRWQAWTNANPHPPKTLTSYYMGGSGFVTVEEAWAENVSLGSIVLNDVPVHPSGLPGMTEGSSRQTFQAILGLTALQRLDCIVDGPSGIIYVRARTGPFPKYSYNRAGAMFNLHYTKDKPVKLTAEVMEGGPAYKAGIRDGDVITRFNGLPIPNAKEGPTYISSTYPAGTQLNFTIKRGDTTFDAVVILEDLFPPTASGTDKPKTEAGLQSSQ